MCSKLKQSKHSLAGFSTTLDIGVLIPEDESEHHQRQTVASGQFRGAVCNICGQICGQIQMLKCLNTKTTAALPQLSQPGQQ